MKNELQIKLVRGMIGATVGQRANLKGLGLMHREAVVRREDTASVRGMIAKVIHLVEVSRATGPKAIHVKRPMGVQILPGAPVAPKVKKSPSKKSGEKVSAKASVAPQASKVESKAPKKVAAKTRSPKKES